MRDRQTDIDPDLLDVLRMAPDSRLKGVRVCLPGIVRAFDAATCRAQVEPAITETDGVSVGVIDDVPVCFPQSGSWVIEWPLVDGDEVLLVFAERGVARWSEYGGLQPPEGTRSFDWTDAVAIPGPISRAKATVRTQAGYVADAMVIRKADGSSWIHLQTDVLTVDASTVILLGEQAQEYVALANLVLAELQGIKQAFDNHTHAGVTVGAGVSGMPSVPLPDPGSVAATKVKAQ